MKAMHLLITLTLGFGLTLALLWLLDLTTTPIVYADQTVSGDLPAHLTQ